MQAIFTGEAGISMQAACTWVTPVNKPRIMIDYFDAGIGNIDT